MEVISTYFKEDKSGAYADVVLDSDVYKINFYDSRGTLLTTESFVGYSLFYVEDAAENWVKGIKVLNG